MAKKAPLLGYYAFQGDGGIMSNYTPTMRERVSDMMRKVLFSDDRAGQEKAERVSNVLDFTPVGVATGMYDAGRDLGGGNYAGAAINLGMAGLPGPPVKGIRAFHGSPHSFDKFSMDKIGTGEGAQAYGHGLYFAENERVAKGYRDNLTADRTQPAQRLLNKHNNDVDAAISAAKAEIDRLQSLNLTPETGLDRAKSMIETQENNIAMLNQMKNSGNMSPGSMYEVNINADPESFLDWDKPLSEQPEAVRKALGEGSEAAGPALKRAYNNKLFGGDIVGTNEATPQEVTRALASKGIPGIKYLDAGSRGKGDGSRNYVVFDDKLIDIVRKYGIAGASAMAGYNILDGMSEAQAAELNRIEMSRPQ